LAPLAAPPDRRPLLCLTAGPLAAERQLLRDLEGAAGDGLADPLLLVVPSRSLRQHLQARVVAAAGRAVLGVRCITLFGLAQEVTGDVAGRLLAGGDLFPLFAKRLARRERALRQALEHLTDGYSALLGSVRDLLDAGLEPALEDALLEALAAEGETVASRREIARAQALVRVATGTLGKLAEVGAGRRSTLLAAAADRVRHGDAGDLRARAIWVYGFADATGVATDLIASLVTRFGGRVYLDQAPDPAAPANPDAGVAFTRRFRQRVESVCRTAPQAGEPPIAASVDVFRALGSDGELREVGVRILALLADSARPEGIAVVARQLGPYARAVRLQFGSLGIPYSTAGVGGAKTRLGRRAEALLDLLRRGQQLSIERWLELVDRRFGDRSRFDLRTGFATLGVGRLHEMEALAADRYRLEHDLKLPVRQGFHRLEAEDATPRDGARGNLVLRHRRVPAAALAEAIDAAQRLQRHLAAWREAGTVGGHRDAFTALVVEHLAWPVEQAEAGIVGAVADAWSALPATAELTYDEFVDGVAARLRDFGAAPLGGEGGGVQVLDVVQARGLTSEHLFLVGLNRELFPRVVREDPLLPDALRRVLGRRGAGVLPDLPEKRAGHDEERFLFAQLLSSSPRITLSWQDTDDEQLPRAPSPLLERLRWTAGKDEWEDPPLARPVVAQAAAVARSSFESAVAVALHGSRRRLVEVLPQVLPRGAGEREALARARGAVLAELDPLPGAAAADSARPGMGPYHGALGRAPAEGPRASQRIFVTALERLDGCPWQAFLERILRLEPVPDPLAALPGITPLLIGGLVHKVLEEIVRRGIPDLAEDMEQARRRIPRVVAWPEGKELGAILRRESEMLCRKEGIAVPGFAAMLARAVEPHLEQARRLDWADGGPHVLGVELEGALEIEDLAGRRRSIHFRADRLDLGDRGLALTDYKTGRKVVSAAKQDAWRRKHLVACVRRGERLQAVAYALAGGEAADSGRYLFLNPDLGDDRGVREVRIAAGDVELADGFKAAAGVALAAWDAGVFFPRVVQPDKDEEPQRCDYCAVRQACSRGDSGARLRLREWMEARQAEFEGRGRLEPDQLVALMLWKLPAEGA
jgi:PD-(D/E)XK nuclease superfamily